MSSAAVFYPAGDLVRWRNADMTWQTPKAIAKIRYSSS